MIFPQLLTTACVAATLLATSARADGWHDNSSDCLKGFYVNANAGFNVMQDVTSSSGSVTGRFTTRPGARVGASVGYMVPLASKTSVGLEFEVGALVNTLDKVTATGPLGTSSNDLEGYYYQLPFIANGVIVCHAIPKWAFYVGGGGGGVYSRLHVHEINGFHVDSDADETDPAFQAMAGVRYQLMPSAEVGVSYKFLGVFTRDSDMVSNHGVVATYTFHF